VGSAQVIAEISQQVRCRCRVVKHHGASSHRWKNSKPMTDDHSQCKMPNVDTFWTRNRSPLKRSLQTLFLTSFFLVLLAVIIRFSEHQGQGLSYDSKIACVYLSFLSLQTPNSGQRRRGERNERMGVPIPNQLGNLGQRCKLPQQGMGAEPQPQTILGRFMCNFVQFYAFLWEFCLLAEAVILRCSHKAQCLNGI